MELVTKSKPDTIRSSSKLRHCSIAFVRRVVALPETIFHKWWNYLCMLRGGRKYGYRFLLAINLMHLLSWLSSFWKKRANERLNSRLSLTSKEICFQPIHLGNTRHYEKPASSPGTAPDIGSDRIQGSLLLKRAILVDGGNSVIHDGSYVKGRWRELPHGFTPVESEKGFHEQASRLPPKREPLEEIPGLSLCLTGPWSSNYFHWLMQYLPILRIAEERHPHLNIDHFLVRGPVKPFQLDSLAEFGIPAHKVRCISGEQSVLVENMLLTTIPCANFRYSTWAIQLLRELAPHNQQKSGPVFLDRPAPNNRRIVNSEEVLSLLADYGAKTVDCSKLSFREQINLAASTQLLIGVHGASLANCVFSSPGTTLLELIPRNYTPPYFSALTSSCGLNHLTLLGSEPGPLPGKIPIYDADIIVPIKRLLRIMDSAVMR